MDESAYRVHSQFGDWEYDVNATEAGWTCNCPDYIYRGAKCKHILAIDFSLQVRQVVKAEIVIAPVNISECEFCRSVSLKKFGVRRNRSGNIQRYICGDYHRTFSINLGFERMKHNPKAITTAMQLYFNGESLRNTADSLRLLGSQVSHQTILNWVRKFVGLMDRYLERITPRVGDVWRTDKLYLKVKGNMKYILAMMGDDTHFWIAQQLSDNKGTSDVRPMFREAIQRAGKKPNAFISDGCEQSPRGLAEGTLDSLRGGRSPQHIRDIRLEGEVHNNKMERMSGEIRDREKVMRGLKRSDTPILKGYRLFHNFIRSHESLGGRTPAEACGIETKGGDKWATLIQNARNAERRAEVGG